MPQTSGLTNAPITRNLIIFLISASVLVTATDTKHLLPIHVPLHFFRLHQYWRLLTWPLAYANSTELLFASLTLYNLRVVERIWGSRKLATFLLTTTAYTSLLPPLLVTLSSALLPASTSFLPSGPTAIIFAILAQYHAAIPHSFKYRLTAASISSPRPDSRSSSSSAAAPQQPNQAQEDEDEAESGVTLTSKATSYLLPAQLALSHLPGSLLAALVGWSVGYAWRADLLPGSGKWRVPGWVVGERGGEKARAEEAERVRRRMAEEAGGSSARRSD